MIKGIIGPKNIGSVPKTKAIKLGKILIKIPALNPKTIVEINNIKFTIIPVINWLPIKGAITDKLNKAKNWIEITIF